MMEEAFAAYLTTPALGIVGDRVDWVVHAQASGGPYIVLHNITTIPVYSDEGYAGLDYSRIQIDHWAKTYALAKGAARETTQRLKADGEGKFTHGGIEFQIAFKADEQDSFEQGSAAQKLHRVRIDFDIWYK